jgi:hypothetical protein
VKIKKENWKTKELHKKEKDAYGKRHCKEGMLKKELI